MSFTIVVITELLAKHVPLMPVADIRNSAKDDAFVHFIVELLVYVPTHNCVLFLILFCIYKGFFTARLETRFISLLFFFFLCAVCLFGLLLTILLTLPCRRISKTCFSDSNRPLTLGKRNS